MDLASANQGGWRAKREDFPVALKKKKDFMILKDEEGLSSYFSQCQVIVDSNL